jgi:hypothetical protein
VPVCYIRMWCCSFVTWIAENLAITLPAVYYVGMIIEPWESKRVVLVMRRRISSGRTLSQTFFPAIVKSLPLFTGTDFLLALFELPYLNYTIRKLNPYPNGAPFPSHWLADWMWMQQVGQSVVASAGALRLTQFVLWLVSSSQRWMKHLAYFKTVLPAKK